MNPTQIPIEIITSHLADALDGAPTLSVDDAEAAHLLAAFRAVVGDPLAVRAVGLATIKLINGRLKSGVIAEREINQFREGGGQIC